MKKIFIPCIILLIFSGCVTNPLTGKQNMAFISNSQLFSMSFTQYNDFLKENKVVTGTPEAAMITRVGNKLADAAQKMLAAEGQSDYLKDYKWQFSLVEDDAINAWAMPGGKIVFYTGILPVTRNEAGIAVVMGHEIAHQILNHGQQRMSAGILQQIGALGVTILTANQSPEAQALILAAYGIGTNLAGALPFSRKHEYEADEYGLYLMAIAGYNPEEGAVFWQRMNASGAGRVPEFLSTHPSPPNRISNLRKLTPEAKRKASQYGVRF